MPFNKLDGIGHHLEKERDGIERMVDHAPVQCGDAGGGVCISMQEHAWR